MMVTSTSESGGDATPTISIGLPVYNGHATLAAALDSLLAQTFRDFEVIICDNASTDDTPAIAREYAERDSRIRYHRSEENRGAAANFNRAFELSRGEYFKWHAADDLLLPEFLEACIEPLRAQPDVVLSYPTRQLIGHDGSPLPGDPYLIRYRQLPEDQLDDLSQSDLLRTHPSRVTLFVFGLIRSSVLAKTALIGAFPSSDVTLVYELRLHGRFAQIPRPLYVQRLHPMSASSRSRMTRKGDAAWFGASRGLALHGPEAKLFLEMLKAQRRAAGKREPGPDGPGSLATARQLLALRAHVEIRTARWLDMSFRKLRRGGFKFWSRSSESFLAPDAPKLWALRLWRGGAAAFAGHFGRARKLFDPRESAQLLTESLGRMLDRSSDESLRLVADWLASEDPETAGLAVRAYALGTPESKARFLAYLDVTGAQKARERLDALLESSP